MVQIEELPDDPSTDDIENIEPESTQNEVTEEEDSQISESDDDINEIDFTKNPSIDKLTGKLKQFKVKGKVRFGNDCSGCCNESDNDECEPQDFFEDTQKGKRKMEKDENLTTKRVVAFIMIFPMLVTVGFMASEMLGNFKVGKSSMQLTAAIGGAIIAIVIMSQVAVLRSALKLVLCFSWIIFLIPTYQVYSCSPVELKNGMLGTWFSLKTTASKFNDESYTTSVCMRASKFPTPYKLSLMSLKVSLKVDINELINLNMENDVSDRDAERSLHYFMLVSKRSVKKKFHKIYLIVEAASKHSEILRKALKLNESEKDKYLLLMTGSIVDIDDALLPMKEELESMNYIVRPIKFKIHTIQHVDRYVKLHNNDNLY